MLLSRIVIFLFDCLDVALNEGGGSLATASSNTGDAEGGGETGAEGEEDKGQQKHVPDYKTQRTEIHTALQQRLKQGDTW